MGVFTNIEAALNTTLKHSTNTFIQWPNTNKSVDDHTPFARPTNLPAISNLETLAGSTKHTGIYQVDIFCPLNEGTNQLTSIMDEINTYFQSSRDISAGSNVVRIQAIERGLAERQESWLVGSLSINYICYS